MALSSDDIEAIAVLVKKRLQPSFELIDQRFEQVLSHLDGLYRRDESREQEYLSIREQLQRADKQLREFDKRLVVLERKAS